MNKYLDYKATVWFRIPIESEEALEKVKEKIEEGVSPSEFYNDLDIELGQCELITDTIECINPNENDGYSTIEIYSGNDNNCQDCIWDNSSKNSHKGYGINQKLKERNNYGTRY